MRQLNMQVRADERLEIRGISKRIHKHLKKGGRDYKMTLLKEFQGIFISITTVFRSLIKVCDACKNVVPPHCRKWL